MQCTARRSTCTMGLHTIASGESHGSAQVPPPPARHHRPAHRPGLPALSVPCPPTRPARCEYSSTPLPPAHRPGLPARFRAVAHCTIPSAVSTLVPRFRPPTRPPRTLPCRAHCTIPRYAHPSVGAETAGQSAAALGPTHAISPAARPCPIPMAVTPKAALRSLTAAAACSCACSTCVWRSAGSAA
jgi:hypothetical protein